MVKINNASSAWNCFYYAVCPVNIYWQPWNWINLLFLCRWNTASWITNGIWSHVSSCWRILCSSWNIKFRLYHMVKSPLHRALCIFLAVWMALNLSSRWLQIQWTDKKSKYPSYKSCPFIPNFILYSMNDGYLIR